MAGLIGARGVVAGLLVLVWGLGCAGCEDEVAGPGSCAASYGVAPEGASATLFVAKGCEAAGDGTKASPYGTIQAAIDAAGAGPTAILVADGTYDEALRIEDKTVWIIGAGAADESAAAGIILHAPKPVAVGIRDADGTILRGIAVEGAAEAGIVVEDSQEIRIEGSRVSGTKAAEDGSLGMGMSVARAGIILHYNAITGSEGVGILMTESAGIILHHEVDDNAGGGISVEGCSDAACTEAVRIEETKVRGNALFGVRLLSSKGIILHSEVRETTHNAANQLGDGVVASTLEGGAPADLTLDNETIVADNARIGVFFKGQETRGIILHKTALTGNALGGVWLQGAGAVSPVKIEDALIADNGLVGVAMSGAARGVVTQSEVRGTTQAEATLEGGGSVSMGDAVGVFSGAEAEVRENTLSDNARVGVIVEGAAPASVVADNLIEGNGAALVAQNQDQLPTIEGNAASGNAEGDALQELTGPDAKPVHPALLDGDLE